MIEARPGSISLGEVFDSPAYQSNREIIARIAREKLDSDQVLDDGLKALIAQQIDELPFHRVIDVELGLGFPDILGLCLEAHPTNQAALDACAAVMIFGATVSSNLKYRWDLVVHRSSRGNIHQLQLGPGAGLRYLAIIGFDGSTREGLAADFMASLEYVYWIANHFGLTAQLDLGTTVLVTYDNGAASDLLPYFKLTVGMAF